MQKTKVLQENRQSPENISRLLRSGHEESLDAVLSLRRNQLPKGSLPFDRLMVAKEIEGALLACIGTEESGAKAYVILAKSISRLISLYYAEDGKLLYSITPKLQTLILHLGEYLCTEISVALDLGLPKSLIGISLARFSISEISDAYYYVKDVAADGDDVVASNLSSIISAALRKGDLNIAYGLAKDAKKTKNDIVEKYKDNKLVMAHLSNIINAALSRGNLNIAYNLAEGAMPTQDKLVEKYKDNKIVMDHLSTIISIALNKANLNTAYDLAEKVKHASKKRLRVLMYSHF